MYLSNESLLVILLVGLVAGFLAGKIVRIAGIGELRNELRRNVGSHFDFRNTRRGFRQCSGSSSRV